MLPSMQRRMVREAPVIDTSSGPEPPVSRRSPNVPDQPAAGKGAAPQKPLILITGATGNLGQSIGGKLAAHYRVVGLDRDTEGPDFPVIEVDLSNDASVELALRKVADEHGSRIASVIHLLAFFDFSGEPNRLYDSVNVEGTHLLLKGLQALDVQQFLYASTMLVHAPCRPGARAGASTNRSRSTRAGPTRSRRRVPKSDPRDARCDPDRDPAAGRGL